MHESLTRLDQLAAALAADPATVAVLGLGSAGLELDRFDEHSDIDFFVVVDTAAAKQRLVDDVGWLASMGEVAYSFANDPNGRKALFTDGLFVEYAIFVTDELPTIPYAGARIVWQRNGIGGDLSRGAPSHPASAPDTVDFHLNEALTNVFVGLHRELRGEHLTACRFIQVYAVDHVLALARLTLPPPPLRDPFDATRRVETGYSQLAEPLRHMVTGYDGNVGAARAVVSWLSAHYDPDPAIVDAIDRLLTAPPAIDS